MVVFSERRPAWSPIAAWTRARVEQFREEPTRPGRGHHALTVIEDFEGAVQLGSGGCGGGRAPGGDHYL